MSRSVASSLVPLLLLVACDSSRVSKNPPNHAAGDSTPQPGLATKAQPLGEIVDGFPNDHERMVHLLTNLSRHAALNDCGDWTGEQGAEVNKPPLVYSRSGNVAGRYMSKHMADRGCFQHESCCVLGDVGGGEIGCVGAANCGGAACGQECTGGTPIAQRYGMLGMNTWSGENIARGQASAYAVWCAWMNSDGHRANIYSGHNELGVGAFNATGSCSGWYWTQAFGSGGGAIPRIPVASAMYAPPNPRDATNMYFAANYFDATGLAPKRATVVVNGHCIDLKKEWGHDGNGTYEAHFRAPDDLPPGCHPYYFLVIDGDAQRHVYPSDGSLFVAVGNGTSCPNGYEPGQLDADCETGNQTCTEGDVQSCYTGPAGTEGVGECKSGYQVCTNGFWSSCRDQKVPFPEVCDGVDNNCDGQVDDGNPGGNVSCVVAAERGECKAGTKQCTGGALVCVSNVSPQVEICDGKDNDCDGEIDDGFGAVSCGTGECFRIVQVCQNGVLQTCEPGTPTPEVPDNKDNDCNGLIDDGFDCGAAGQKRLCYSFPLGTTEDGGTVTNIISPCSRGIQTCQSDGGWGPCEGEVGPAPEVCDGVDNDCDGDRDEPSELGWQRCGTGGCTQWALMCRNGQPNTCQPSAPKAEACNGVDDSCDGTIDEGCTCRDGLKRSCYDGPAGTRGVGECRDGERVCVDGQWSACTGSVEPSTEWCDPFDQDCDGLIAGEDCSIPPTDGGTTGPDGGVLLPDGGTDPDEPGTGCGCATAGSAGLLPFALLALLGRARRRGVAAQAE